MLRDDIEFAQAALGEIEYDMKVDNEELAITNYKLSLIKSFVRCQLTHWRN